MKLRAWALLLFMAAALFAKDMGGFAGIRFGLSRDKVIEEILKLGYDPLGQTTQADRLIIPVYELGDLPVEVTFMFNRNGKFHSFEIRTGRVEAERYTKVVDAVRYMSEQFELKYGTSTKQSYPRPEEIRSGYRAFFRQWNNSELEIYTSISSMDGRYFSVGSVTHKILSREGRTSSANYDLRGSSIKAPAF
jgi:hypothetical protein